MSEYKSEVAKFQKDLQGLLRERAELDNKITYIRQVLEGLSSLSGIEIDRSLLPVAERDVFSLTSCIHQVLQEPPHGWNTAAEVRKLLLKFDVNLSRYANSSAVINTVLNRLHKQGLVEKDTSQGTARYRDCSAEKTAAEFLAKQREAKRKNT
jgi:hypothetical protein